MQQKKKKKETSSSLSDLRKLRKPEDAQTTSNRKTVTKHELDMAEAVGGRPIGTKGPRQTDPCQMIGQKRSDARSARYEIECKQTGKQSLALKLEWLIDITRHALANKRIPLVSARFLAAPTEVDKDWVILPLSEFRKLYDLARGNDETLGKMTEEDWQ